MQRGILTYKDCDNLYLRLEKCCSRLNLPCFVVGRDVEYFDWDSNNKIYNIVYYSPFESTLYLNPYAILTDYPEFKDFEIFTQAVNYKKTEIPDFVYALSWKRNSGGWEHFMPQQVVSEKAQSKFSDFQALDVWKAFGCFQNSQESICLILEKPKFVTFLEINGFPVEKIIYDPQGFIDVLCLF
jgi:hypothetical protein